MEESDIEAMMRTPVAEKQDAELTRWQLMVEDIILELEHDFRGEIFMEDENKWEVKGESLMNEKGIRSIIGVLRASVHKILFLSNLTEDDVYLITRDTHIELACLLAQNIDNFEIKKAYLSSILNKVVFITYEGLRRAFMGGERTFLKQTERRIERIIDRLGSEKKSLNPFGR
jgi:hypothetical protein